MANEIYKIKYFYKITPATRLQVPGKGEIR